MTEGIRIDALLPTVLPSREHEFPAMREGLTVKLSVGQILALLTAGDIEFDPGTGGPLDAETIQAAIDELAAAYVSTRPQTFGAAARSQARLNIGSDYAPGTVNIASLSSGVLEIPAEGEHFVLTWPGNADFTITGFGDLRPAGKTFSILVPRTIADTGGTNYARGNKVSFVHTSSGAGLDLTMNRRMIGDSPIYTYDAYPNACGSHGDAASLYEQLTFVPLGSGRHRLMALPAPATITRGGVPLHWKATLYPDGWVEMSGGGVESRSATGALATTVNLPMSIRIDEVGFAPSLVMSLNAGTGTIQANNGAGATLVNSTQISINISRTTTANTYYFWQLEGYWK